MTFLWGESKGEWTTAATSTGHRFVTVKAERHHESTRRWRWLPWPRRKQWWSFAELDNGVQAFCCEDSRAALTKRFIEQVRFLYEDDDTLGVAVWWQDRSSPKSSPSSTGYRETE